jgi:hypothetical protein
VNRRVRKLRLRQVGNASTGNAPPRKRAEKPALAPTIFDHRHYPEIIPRRPGGQT